MESIAEITPQTLYDCHKAFYTPANMVLTVVGDVRPDRVFEAAERILPAESGPDIERDYGDEPEAIAREGSHPPDGGLCPPVPAGLQVPAAGAGRERLSGRSFWAIIAWDILLGESSPLYQRLYENGTHQRQLRRRL